MKPTIGRIIIFRDRNGVEQPAIINRVWSETCVNVFVMPDAGATYNYTSALLDGSAAPNPQTWQWPNRE